MYKKCHCKNLNLVLLTMMLLMNPSLPRVATIMAIGLGETYEHKFPDGVEGRFVTLALTGEERYLTLCEVEVYGYPAPTGENT